jgi:hypothetical protein
MQWQQVRVCMVIRAVTGRSLRCPPAWLRAALRALGQRLQDDHTHAVLVARLPRRSAADARSQRPQFVVAVEILDVEQDVQELVLAFVHGPEFRLDLGHP